ncbi:hypothetical protein EVAR_2735_1 [Eumeta japonica]|uniref:Uncharacterized protein n=1 Tax=Eumeta variegata TaxID=151549 RepID=A0A4C1T229_EUMVA|nr:hypothetical protein EVAR_2735_1 [Eumeta japonica]
MTPLGLRVSMGGIDHLGTLSRLASSSSPRIRPRGKLTVSYKLKSELLASPAPTEYLERDVTSNEDIGLRYNSTPLNVDLSHAPTPTSMTSKCRERRARRRTAAYRFNVIRREKAAEVGKLGIRFPARRTAETDHILPYSANCIVCVCVCVCVCVVCRCIGGKCFSPRMKEYSVYGGAVFGDGPARWSDRRFPFRTSIDVIFCMGSVHKPLYLYGLASGMAIKADEPPRAGGGAGRARGAGGVTVTNGADGRGTRSRGPQLIAADVVAEQSQRSSGPLLRARTNPVAARRVPVNLSNLTSQELPLITPDKNCLCPRIHLGDSL